MKYGLLWYEKTDNMGDDIQSYAGRQFLPHIDYYIDREHLDTFMTSSQERVAVIMNAWYLHNKFNWPPSPYIFPLLTSMHFSTNDHLGIGTAYLGGFGGEYLRDYGPVGCRDEETKRLLDEEKIESYFSGCLTLTLPKQPLATVEQPYVCAVDVPQDVWEYLVKYLKNKNG